jgi:hypothetical protein
MVTMFKKVLLVLAVILVVFVVVVALQPSTYHVERSATIAAPPAAVFAEVNDFHNWEKWSPWAKIDPNAKYSYEGPTAGTGAIIRWAGNSDVGEGSMTITESKPNEQVRIRLQFLKPMAGTATTAFTFQPEGDKTRVIWSMDGENNFVAKAFCLFMNMDKMIGEKYEEGLANMKAVVEARKQ